MSTHIGELIRRRREELEYTQEELAAKLGYKSKTTIAKIEAGINDINQTKILAFAKALDVSVSYLMGWEENDNNFHNIEIPDLETILGNNNRKYLVRFISSFVKLQRVTNDMTEKQVSTQIGIDLEEYFKFENGNMPIDNKILHKALDMNKLSMSYVKGALSGLSFLLSAIDNEGLNESECDARKNIMIDSAINGIKEAIFNSKEN